MDIQVLLRTLGDFEGKLAELYQSFSILLKNDPDAASVFRQLSKEERAHVALIEFQRRLARNSPSEFKDVSLDLKPVQEVLAKIAELQAAPCVPSLEEALHSALAFEASAAEYHYKTAMQQANPGAARLLEALSSGDRDHLAKLTEFAQTRGVEQPAGA